MRIVRVSAAFRLALVLGAVTSLAACGPGTPSEEQAKRAFAAIVDSGSAERLRITRFEKTDGQRAEFGGIALYNLEFSATVDVDSAVLITLGDGLGSGRIESRVVSPADSAQPVIWSRWFAQAVAVGAALLPGDAIQVKGSVDFEMKESGWYAGHVKFRSTIDSSRRRLASTDARGGGEAAARTAEGPMSGTPIQGGPAVDPFAETPLGEAARTGDITRVRRLLESGVDVNQPFGYKRSQTALMAAAKAGRFEVVKLLVTAGARVNESDGTGNTALGLAAASGDLATVRLLITAGSALRGGGDAFPEPPLHMAARAGHIDVVRALFEAGADRAEKFLGKTAADAAREAGHLDVVRLLESGSN